MKCQHIAAATVAGLTISLIFGGGALADAAELEPDVSSSPGGVTGSPSASASTTETQHGTESDRLSAAADARTQTLNGLNAQYVAMRTRFPTGFGSAIPGLLSAASMNAAAGDATGLSGQNGVSRWLIVWEGAVDGQSATNGQRGNTVLATSYYTPGQALPTLQQQLPHVEHNEQVTGWVHLIPDVSSVSALFTPATLEAYNRVIAQLTVGSAYPSDGDIPRAWAKFSVTISADVKTNVVMPTIPLILPKFTLFDISLPVFRFNPKTAPQPTMRTQIGTKASSAPVSTSATGTAQGQPPTTRLADTGAGGPSWLGPGIVMMIIAGAAMLVRSRHALHAVR